MEYAGGRGAADSLGVITLAAGDHSFVLYHYEGNGGSGLEFSAAPGARSAFDSTVFRLVGDVYNGGLATVGLDALVGTNVQTAMRNVNTSAYVRIHFDVEDPAEFDLVKLQMQYADGFVAYLNGQEIARSNAPAGTPAWNAAATADRGGLLAYAPRPSTSRPACASMRARASRFCAGENVLAIHGLNASLSEANFLVLPTLIGSTIRADGSVLNYFTTPTPDAENLPGAGHRGRHQLQRRPSGADRPGEVDRQRRHHGGRQRGDGDPCRPRLRQRRHGPHQRRVSCRVQRRVHRRQRDRQFVRLHDDFRPGHAGHGHDHRAARARGRHCDDHRRGRNPLHARRQHADGHDRPRLQHSPDRRPHDHAAHGGLQARLELQRRRYADLRLRQRRDYAVARGPGPAR